MASTIATSLEPALQKLSEIFCVSVDAIRENGMEYILMYGEYHYLQSLITMLVFLFFGLFIISLFIDGFFIIEADCDPAKVLIWTCVSILIFMIIGFIAKSIPYWVCPEMYSINAVMELVR